MLKNIWTSLQFNHTNMQQTLNLTCENNTESFNTLLSEFYALDAQIDEQEDQLWEEFLNDETGSIPSPRHDDGINMMRVRARKLLTRIQNCN